MPTTHKKLNLGMGKNAVFSISVNLQCVCIQVNKYITNTIMKLLVPPHIIAGGEEQVGQRGRLLDQYFGSIV